MTPETTFESTQDVKASVREKYGQAAQRVIDGNTDASCCGSSACCGSTTEVWDPITANLYDDGQKQGIPAEALLASLGCGNPTALAELHEGETVLDLGSGGGIDVLLSADRKSTRLNSSHITISYAVFCLKKKKLQPLHS